MFDDHLTHHRPIDGGPMIEAPKVIDGTEGDDTLVGGSGDDTIDGLGGNDVLHGSFGDDSLVGGSGSDILFGNPGDDTLVGGDGNDILHGGQGTDLLEGGADDDVLYAGKHGGTLDGGAGIDTLNFKESRAKHLVVDLNSGTATSNHGVYVLLGIEAVTGATSAIEIDGDANANRIGGSKFADVLSGGLGDDSIGGGLGHDTITGGGGADLMAGGPDSDFFVFLDVSDSPLGAPDHILDLEKKDKIDLSAIDADTTQAGDQAFHLVDHFTGQAGDLTTSYNPDADSVYIEGDVDGDGVADFRIIADGPLPFEVKHFIL